MFNRKLFTALTWILLVTGVVTVTRGEDPCPYTKWEFEQKNGQNAKCYYPSVDESEECSVWADEQSCIGSYNVVSVEDYKMIVVTSQERTKAIEIGEVVCYTWVYCEWFGPPLGCTFTLPLPTGEVKMKFYKIENCDVLESQGNE